MASFPRLHEVFRLPAPAERAGVIGVVVPDVALDRRNALVKRVEDSVLQPLPGQLREEPLHGVHPGRRGRGEVELPVGAALQPFVDLGRLVRGDVVEDTCTGVPGAIPSATWSRKARNSSVDDLAGGGVDGLHGKRPPCSTERTTGPPRRGP